MVRRLSLFLMALLFSANLFAQALTAVVDRNKIGLGESVELVLVLQDARGERPDLTELSQDFRVSGHSHHSSMSFSNNRMSQESRWTFLLTPNRKGMLTIPSLKVGAMLTDPIQIEVGDEPVAQSSNDDVVMQVEVKPEHPYVNGQVMYIQRLYYSRPLVNNASISRPVLSKGEADIEQIGSSRPRSEKLNGRPYQLIERYYAVFPKKAGVLEFEPTVFRGNLATSRSRQSQFMQPMFNSGARVSAYSAKAELTILEKPEAFTGAHWLPATQVSLSMNWSQSPDSLKAGEPNTVIIALLAEGVKAEALPEIRLDLPAGLKVYPEQPMFTSDKSANGLAGLRQEKFTILANEAGEYSIPGIEVPWWNTDTNQQEVARLDGFTITVDGTVTGPASSTDSGRPDQTEKASPAVVLEDKPERPDVSQESESSSDLFFVQDKMPLIVSLGVIGLASMLGLFLLRRQGRSAGVVDSSKLLKHNAIQALVASCEENDPRAALVALPSWARSVGIRPATLLGIESSGDVALRGAVQALSQASYSRGESTWSGEALLEAVSGYKVSSENNDQEEGLAPLHPIS